MVNGTNGSLLRYSAATAIAPASATPGTNRRKAPCAAFPLSVCVATSPSVAGSNAFPFHFFLRKKGPVAIGQPREKTWRAPSERIRTASEIPIEVALTDEDAVPTYVKTTDKVLHLRRLGMTCASIAERLGINLWMAKRAARWAKTR